MHLFEENSTLRYEIDWDAFRAQVEKIARLYNLETASERLEVSRRVFELLEGRCDVHSGLIMPGIAKENQAAWADGRTPHAPGEDPESPYGINARILEGGFAFIAIPPTSPPGFSA